MKNQRLKRRTHLKKKVFSENPGCSSVHKRSSDKKKKATKSQMKDVSSDDESSVSSMSVHDSSRDELFLKQGSNPKKDDCCLFCEAKFSDDNQGEIWIMCIMCSCWAHEECAGLEKEPYEAGPSSMHDPNFEEWCSKQLEEDDYLVSDDEDGYITESEHDTESEQSGNEELEKENTELRENLRTLDFFYERVNKNPTTLSKQPPPAHSTTRRHNLMVSPSKKLGEIASSVQVWDLLFNENMDSDIVPACSSDMESIVGVARIESTGIKQKLSDTRDKRCDTTDEEVVDNLDISSTEPHITTIVSDVTKKVPNKPAQETLRKRINRLQQRINLLTKARDTELLQTILKTQIEIKFEINELRKKVDKIENKEINQNKVDFRLQTTTFVDKLLINNLSEIDEIEDLIKNEEIFNELITCDNTNYNILENGQQIDLNTAEIICINQSFNEINEYDQTPVKTSRKRTLADVYEEVVSATSEKKKNYKAKKFIHLLTIKITVKFMI
ncbi:hypothetical protein RN001_006711 [Aquatica leii]|uniref:Zinc finger PHD-type domain-containing protein n=1 Tax=Aquatica leii TaxID=1421715 RepID=A0AAN7PDW2_9COLE|nr:hypothetical protein RN001_006711 [Aquatica leii]